MSKLLKTSCLVVLACWVVASLGSEEEIASALRSVMETPHLNTRRVRGTISDYGLTDRIYRMPEFTNLVSAISDNAATCSGTYVYGLTNVVERIVFLGALAECGEDAYRALVVQTLGGETNNIPRDPRYLMDFIFPPHTRLESYFGMNYDNVGISNVLVNVRDIFTADNVTNTIRGVNRVLSGEYKYDHTKWHEAGLDM